MSSVDVRYATLADAPAVANLHLIASRALYDGLVAAARERHPVVATGEFGADMQVHLVNDGPVTIPIRL